MDLKMNDLIQRNNSLTYNRTNRTCYKSVFNYIQQRQTHPINGCSTTKLADFQLEQSKQFHRKNLFEHYGCVNAIEFSRDGQLLASAGDDRRVLLWNVSKTIHGKCKPIEMQAEHRSNAFVVAFDSINSKILSGGNDDQVIIHDVKTGGPLDYYLHEEPVYGISVEPTNDSIFATAGDNGQLLLYDQRAPSTSDPLTLASMNSAFHGVMHNPLQSHLLVSANTKIGITLWDSRKPSIAVMNYGGKNSDQCCMSARFNWNGSQIIGLRRRLPPVLYSTNSTTHLYQFSSAGYYNSCTMKSCAFAGSNDQYIISGSDNFGLYIWKIPEEDLDDRLVRDAFMVVNGHRSIVNQVRYNPTYSILASSGVEKVIKFWSPFTLPGTTESENTFEIRSNYERRIYSNNDYINLILESGQFLSLMYDTARRSTKEDPRMLAFFDALVQRDIEGMSDDEDEDEPEAGSPTCSIRPQNLSDDGAIDEESSVQSPHSQNEEQKINRMIDSKYSVLLRNAKNQIKYEEEGKVKKKENRILRRLKKLSAKAHSLSMNLLPQPGRVPSSSPSPFTIRSTSESSVSSSSSSSSTVSSSSSSSESGNDDDDVIPNVKIRQGSRVIPPLRRRRIISSGDEDFICKRRKQTYTRTRKRRRRPIEPHGNRVLPETTTSDSDSSSSSTEILENQENQSVKVEGDEEPCTSATALKNSQKVLSKKRRVEVQDSDQSEQVEDWEKTLELTNRQLRKVTNELTRSAWILNRVASSSDVTHLGGNSPIESSENDAEEATVDSLLLVPDVQFSAEVLSSNTDEAKAEIEDDILEGNVETDDN